MTMNAMDNPSKLELAANLLRQVMGDDAVLMITGEQCIATVPPQKATALVCDSHKPSRKLKKLLADGATAQSFLS